LGLKIQEAKNYNPNCPNVSEFTNNTNENKIQNAKIKMQNDNAKLKINKIQTPVIASYLEVSGDEAISLNEL
jgi:hypothetical protein